ncbi:Ig-like domain repeat protein, partial [Flavobacterium sp. XS2P24]|uniref:Ig-like domain repeat protein n=1 Tax=Flavobacterium sp. XS2P24 TaxID=3041249 RepID=UPI0024A8DEBE
AEANQDVNLDANCGITVPNLVDGSSATDNCTNTITQLPVAGTVLSSAHNGTVAVVVTATDAAGNTDSETVTLTAKDITNPVAKTQSVTIYLNASGAASITAVQVNNASTDNCAVVKWTLDKTDFVCADTGSNTVVLTVEDVAGNSNTATATVTVKDEVKPVITCKPSASKFVDPYATYYTVSGNEFDATATDACGVASLTYKINGGSASANGASLNGVTLNVGTHTIVWTAIDVNNNSSTCTTTITITKRTTTLTYNGDLSEQYSDVTNLSAILTDNVSGAPIQGKTITFTIGSQSVTGVTNGSGVATATLKITQSPINTYNVVSTFAGDGSYVTSSDTDGFDIQQENALVEYTGPEFVGEQNTSASTTPVLLSASINDIVDGLGLEGDIRNAIVQFYDINGGAAISGWLTPGLVTPGDLTKGIVTYNWSASVPTSGYNSTTVGIRVGTQSPEDNGYYVGYGQTVINVYRISLNEFITGGGHIIPVDSKGQYASDSGKKVNFGFNVKWNKSVKNLQGNLNLIFRKEGKVYQIKSTAMNSLSIISTNPCSQKATFVSKANLTDVTNSALPISIYGGISLQVTMTDNGEPGKSDMIGFTLMDGNNLVYSSSWPVNKTLESFLNGGNLVVHNGVTCTAGTSTTSITSTKNPSVVGDLITFKATVTGAVYVPSGTVTFNNGTTVLATIAMSGGTASYSTSALVVADHVITALYNGDAKFSSSSSSLTQKVNAAPTVRTSAPVIAKQVKEIPVETVPFNVIAYPNPSTQYFIIDIKGGTSEKTEVIVYDILGRMVKHIQNSDSKEIKFGEELSSGSYIAIINQGTQQKTVRLIKQ